MPRIYGITDMGRHLLPGGWWHRILAYAIFLVISVSVLTCLGKPEPNKFTVDEYYYVHNEQRDIWAPAN